MKTLTTQFDDKRFSNAIATPSCCSSCCCCCCLASVITASSMLAQRVSHEGKKHQLPNRQLLTVVAALFFPLILILSYVVSLPLLGLTLLGDMATTETLSIGPMWTPVASPVLLLVLLLWLLYSKVRIQHPLRRALLVSVIVTTAVAAEVYLAFMILHLPSPIIIYLVLVVLIVVISTSAYRSRLKKEGNVTESVWGSEWDSAAVTPQAQPNPAGNLENNTVSAPTTPPAQIIQPDIQSDHSEQPKPEQPKDNITNPDEPPQQNPPATSA